MRSTKAMAKKSKPLSRGAQIQKDADLYDYPEQNRYYKKWLDRLLVKIMPKSLNSFPRRLERLEKAMIADKALNLSYEERLRWMQNLAIPFCDTVMIKRLQPLLKASVSQARKAAGGKGLLQQGKTLERKKKRSS